MERKDSYLSQRVGIILDWLDKKAETLTEIILTRYEAMASRVVKRSSAYQELKKKLEEEQTRHTTERLTHDRTRKAYDELEKKIGQRIASATERYRSEVARLNTTTGKLEKQLAEARRYNQELGNQVTQLSADLVQERKSTQRKLDTAYNAVLNLVQSSESYSKTPCAVIFGPENVAYNKRRFHSIYRKTLPKILEAIQRNENRAEVNKIKFRIHPQALGEDLTIHVVYAVQKGTSRKGLRRIVRKAYEIRDIIVDVFNGKTHQPDFVRYEINTGSG